MKRAAEIAAKIIEDYKEHYHFPNAPQGESHMYDCIMGALNLLFEADGEALALLRDYYAAYPHGRLGDRARAMLGEKYPTVPCDTLQREEK